MTRRLRILCLCIILALASTLRANAQFREEAFSQNYSSEEEGDAEVGESKLFDAKGYWDAITHKGTTDMTNLFLGSTVLIGGGQMNNKDYWKLPILYAGIAGGVGGGLYYMDRYKKTGEARDRQMMTGLFVAGGLTYWGGLMDMTINFKSDLEHNPGKATVYSILLPGLGQMYNKEYWKLPLYYGLFIGSLTFRERYNANYIRFRNIYNEASDPDSRYDGPVTADVALYYRNIYRRYRDYSTLAVVASYLLQVIDANVFAYMQDFEVSDNLSLNISPAVLMPDNAYALNGKPALGMRLGFSF